MCDEYHGSVEVHNRRVRSTRDAAAASRRYYKRWCRAAVCHDPKRRTPRSSVYRAYAVGNRHNASVRRLSWGVAALGETCGTWSLSPLGIRVRSPHPAAGDEEPLKSADRWTPAARTKCGRSLDEAHQWAPGARLPAEAPQSPARYRYAERAADGWSRKSSAVQSLCPDQTDRKSTRLNSSH